jgi:pimeloyl-ACP methyl ester carboxylesterase
MANQQFTLPSGRALGLTAAGDPLSRRLVVVCHPAPGAGGFDPDPLVTAASGVQLVMIDRPGYGSSAPLPRDEDPTTEQFADDLAYFLRQSERVSRNAKTADFGSVGVIGWGAGGAAALSLAARYPELIDRLAIVALPKAGGRGLIEPVRRMLGLSRIESFSPRSELDRVIAAHGPLSLESLGIDDTDPVLTQPGLRGRLDRMIDEAARQGTTGLASDLIAFRDRSWSLDLPAITAETLLIYGDRDPNATVGDGHWYSRRIRGSRVVEVKNAGALAIVSAWSRILAHVSGPGAVLPSASATA